GLTKQQKFAFAAGGGVLAVLGVLVVVVALGRGGPRKDDEPGPDNPVVKKPEEPPDELTSRIRDLENPKPRVRASAARELGRLGKSAVAAIPALVKALRDKEMEVRREAVSALGLVGKEAPSRAVVDGLTVSLEPPGEDERVLRVAVEALAGIGSPDALTA